MGGSGAQHRGEVLTIGVDGARDEGGLRAQGERNRVERMIDRTERCRLRDRAGQRGGGVLPLCQAIDPVVEQQDGQVHIAPQGMDQVVTEA